MGVKAKSISEMSMAKLLIIIGILITTTGLILLLFPGGWGWLGKLPGDLRYEKGNFRFFFPLTTMILISVLISLVLRIFGK